MKKIYSVYLVRCKDNSLYCGITNDLEKRIKEHNSSNTKSAKYTSGRRPVRLVYTQNCHSHSDALRREWEIKKLSKQYKELLIKKKKK